MTLPDNNPASPNPGARPLPPESKPRSWLKVLACVVGAIFLIAIVALFIVYWLSTSAPSYWVKNREFLAQTDPLEVKRLADAVQRRTLAGVSSTDNSNAAPGSPAGTGQTTTMTIPLREINAWLDANLDAWLAHKSIQLPPHIGKFMVATENDRLLVAFESDQPQLKQVITLEVRVEIQSDGQAFLQLQSVRAGSVPIPVQSLLAVIPEPPHTKAHPIADSINDMFAGTTIDPIFHIDKMRQARVTALELQPDAIVVTFKTEKRE